jgi:hypothetical protein
MKGLVYMSSDENMGKDRKTKVGFLFMGFEFKSKKEKG